MNAGPISLDELPPVTFSSLDVSCLLRRMEQLCAEVGALKHITQLQMGVSEQVGAEAVEINHRVSVLECGSGNPTASAAAAAGITPGSEQAFHRGPGCEVVNMRWLWSRELVAWRTCTQWETRKRAPEPVQCSRDGTVAVDAATGKDPAGSVFSTGSPSWSKVVRNGWARQKTKALSQCEGSMLNDSTS